MVAEKRSEVLEKENKKLLNDLRAVAACKTARYKENITGCTVTDRTDS